MNELNEPGMGLAILLAHFNLSPTKSIFPGFLGGLKLAERVHFLKVIFSTYEILYSVLISYKPGFVTHLSTFLNIQWNEKKLSLT